MQIVYNFNQERIALAIQTNRFARVCYEDAFKFANKRKQPALILKTSGATNSIIDKEDCLNKIKEIKSQFPEEWKLPNVYLLHGDLSTEEMNYLYNHPKVKSLVSLTHGEGFGRPLLESTMTGLHVIASGWSGQLDFLDNSNSVLLPGKLQNVPESVVWKDIIIKESQWFVGDESTFYKALNVVHEDYEKYKRKANQLMNINREKFTLKKMEQKLDDIMKRLKKT